MVSGPLCQWIDKSMGGHSTPPQSRPPMSGVPLEL